MMSLYKVLSHFKAKYPSKYVVFKDGYFCFTSNYMKEKFHAGGTGYETTLIKFRYTSIPSTAQFALSFDELLDSIDNKTYKFDITNTFDAYNEVNIDSRHDVHMEAKSISVADRVLDVIELMDGLEKIETCPFTIQYKDIVKQIGFACDSPASYRPLLTFIFGTKDSLFGTNTFHLAKKSFAPTLITKLCIPIYLPKLDYVISRYVRKSMSGYDYIKFESGPLEIYHTNNYQPVAIAAMVDRANQYYKNDIDINPIREISTYGYKNKIDCFEWDITEGIGYVGDEKFQMPYLDLNIDNVIVSFKCYLIKKFCDSVPKNRMKMQVGMMQKYATGTYKDSVLRNIVAMYPMVFEYDDIQYFVMSNIGAYKNFEYPR